MIKLLHSAPIVLGFTLATLNSLTVKAQTIAASSDPSTTDSAFTSQSPDWLNSLESQLLAQQQQSRVALVIGNSSYPEDRLANPVNDATDIAEALRTLGFEVTLLLDQDLRSMENALESFRQQQRQGSVGVFYYAGHGVQVDGENYLIPLSARLNSQNDVRYEALALGKILNAMEESESQVNVIIIDACRDNPFYRRWRSGSRTLSSQRGLAFQVPPEGTIISFATSPDGVAADGTGRNSPYTSSLLQHIYTEGADINSIFRAVRADVKEDTDGQQIPWYQESLAGFFSFNPASNATDLPPNSTLPQSLISATTEIDYRAIGDVLSAGNFKQADLITRSLMLEAMGNASDSWLSDSDLRNFPCEDLEIINQLWFDYSDGKFGFSVQRDIYQALGGTTEYNSVLWDRFGDQVGWRRDRRFWLYSHNLTLSNNSLRGGLPALWGWRFVGGVKDLVFVPFFPAVHTCEL